MEGNFEKTRIQNPDTAHEEANMLRVEAGEAPTAEDYDVALEKLEELQEVASHGSESIDKVTKPLRIALAGFIAVTGRWPELLTLAILNAGGAVGMVPKRLHEQNRRELIEKLKQIPKDYESDKLNLSTARERLEQWKAKAATREQE